jgi:hypothetical protein
VGTRNVFREKDALDGLRASAVTHEHGDTVFGLMQRQHVLRSRELSWLEGSDGRHVRSLGAT